MKSGGSLFAEVPSQVMNTPSLTRQLLKPQLLWLQSRSRVSLPCRVGRSWTFFHEAMEVDFDSHDCILGLTGFILSTLSMHVPPAIKA